MKRLAWLILALVLVLMIATIPTVGAADVVVVTAPNGGEAWNDTKTITWTQETTDATNDTFSVGYTTDTTVTWIATALAAGTTSYSWDTTAVSDGTAYNINVTKVNPNIGDVWDISDADFTVDNTDPTVTITTELGLTSADSVWTYSGTIIISGDAIDATAQPSTATVNGNPATLSGSGTSRTYSYGLSVDIGETTITSTITDNAGNAKTSKTITVTRYEVTGELPTATPPKKQPFFITGEGEVLPGFEAVFAIVGLLAVAYLVLRRREE